MKRNENQQLISLIRREAKIERLRRDFNAFVEEQTYVRPEVGEIYRPKLRFAQTLVEYVIEKQLKEKGWIRLCEFKVRQHGGSTHGIFRATHRAFLNPNIKALIVAQDNSTASNLFRMAELCYEAMDKDIRPVRRYLTKEQIVLENPDVKSRGDFPGLRSRIEIQSATNVHAGVGTTPNWLHASEMCRFGRIQDLKSSLIPAIPLMPGTAIIYESAPTGYGEGRDEFRATCEAARSGKSPFAFIGIYWWMVEKYVLPLDKGETLKLTASEKQLINHVKRFSKKEYGKEITLSPEQLKYRRARIWELGQGDQAIGEALFMQQFCDDYEGSWLTFDRSAFNRYKLQMMEVKHVRPPLRRCEVINREIIDVQGDAPFWIWENPVAGEQYDIGVDPGPGTDGGSKSAFQIIKRSNNEQVAEYEGSDKPFDFEQIIYTAGMYYNAAHVGVEIENVGSVVDEALKQEGYPNIYRWRYRNHAAPKISELSGWKTQYDTKRMLIATTANYIEHDDLIIHSVRVLNQLKHFKEFITDGGAEVYDVNEGFSDLAMALFITVMIARDEKMLELPIAGDESLNGRPTTLEERNRYLLEGIHKSAAYCDPPDKSGLIAEDRQQQMMRDYREGRISMNDEPDPFEKLARAMRGEP